VSTTTHIQNWIYVWRPIILFSAQMAKDWSIQGMRTLTDYFVPDPTTTNVTVIPTPALTAQQDCAIKIASLSYPNQLSSFDHLDRSSASSLGPQTHRNTLGS
jgi:hypothetical protein